MKIILVAAMCQANRVIGKGGKLPWHIPEDMKIFREKTREKTVIMGRKTFESILEYNSGKPLPKRRNVVLTRDKSFQFEGVEVFHSIEEAVNVLKEEADELMVIWWAKIYEDFLEIADEIYLSEVWDIHEWDAFFPEFHNIYKETSREKITDQLDFVVYKNVIK